MFRTWIEHDNKPTLELDIFGLIVKLTRYLIHPMTCLYNSISISKDSLVVLGASSKDNLQVVGSGVHICLKYNMSKWLRMLDIYCDWDKEIMPRV